MIYFVTGYAYNSFIFVTRWAKKLLDRLTQQVMRSFIDPWLSWYMTLTHCLISGPRQNLKTEFKVTLFTKIVLAEMYFNVELVREIFALLWTFQTGVILTYFEMKDFVSTSTTISNSGFKSISSFYSASLVFLLLDDPKVAYDFCKEVEVKKRPPSMTIVFYMLLQNGSKKMIRNWDLKALSALKLITSFFISKNSQNKVNNNEILEKRDIKVLDIELLEEFSKMCELIEGKESNILSSLRRSCG